MILLGVFKVFPSVDGSGLREHVSTCGIDQCGFLNNASFINPSFYKIFSILLKIRVKLMEDLAEVVKIKVNSIYFIYS